MVYPGPEQPVRMKEDREDVQQQEGRKEGRGCVHQLRVLAVNHANYILGGRCASPMEDAFKRE